MIGKRVATATVISMLLVVALGASPAAAANKTRMVDDDGRARPGACDADGFAYASIQAGVDASSSWDTVLVCPGRYEGEVSIGPAKTGLILKSTTPLGARIIGPDSYNDNDHDLIEIHADQATLQGFRIVATTDPSQCDWTDTAVAVTDATDVLITGNRIQVNGTDTIGECGLGTGIRVGFFCCFRGIDFSDAVITGNTIVDFTFAGIAWLSFSAVAISGNTVSFLHENEDSSADENGCAAICTRAARGWSTRGPAPRGPGFFFNSIGILVDGGESGYVTGNHVASGPDAVLIDENRLGLEGTPMLDLGIGVFERGGEQLLVDLNDARRVEGGYFLGGVDSVLMRDNIARRAGFGFGAELAFGNVVRKNTISLTGTGIRFLSSTEDNAIVRNTLTDNSTACVDESSGGGTEGTANYWSGNVEGPSLPDGLCNEVAPI